MPFTCNVVSGASADRLEKLIDERLVAGAEVNAACKLGEDMAKAGEILTTGSGVRKARLPPETRLEPLVTVPAGTESAFTLLYRDP